MIIIEAQEVTEEEPYIWVLLLLQEEVMVADSQAAEVLEAALVASAAVHSVEVVPAVAGSLCDYLSPHSLLFFNGDIASAGTFYYTFRQGPVAFIVLDAGETGHSRSILYNSSDVYKWKI